MANGGEVLSHLIPNGGWVLYGDEFEGIQFMECEPITKQQFLNGFAAVDAIKAKAETDKAAAKASAQAKLAALGLTNDEVAAIVGNQPKRVASI